MEDIFAKKQRSETMKAVKSKGNISTEIKLISIFKSHKIKGWRRNSTITGHPDFVFPKRRIAVFADGCFWHGHDCRKMQPSNNSAYWEAKINRNKTRDKFITSELTRAGWKVIRIWECEIKRGAIRKLRLLLS